MTLIGHSDPDPQRERIGGGQEAECQDCGRIFTHGWSVANGKQHARLYRHEVITSSSVSFRFTPAVAREGK